MDSQKAGDSGSFEKYMFITNNQDIKVTSSSLSVSKTKSHSVIAKLLSLSLLRSTNIIVYIAGIIT